MLEGNYQKILELLSRSSGLEIEDIERRIEAKRAKLSGLISKEGAAQVVAAELGISFDKQKMKISELMTGMKRINVVGKIIKMNRVIEYNKNEKQGKIGSFLLADETGNIRVVLWDTNHIGLIEKKEIEEDFVVEISNASIRNNELHLTGFSDIKKSSESLGEVKKEIDFNKKTISELGISDNASVRAFVVQVFEPRFFIVCPECGKKVSEEGECKEHGKVVGEKRAIVNFILDDGSETIRAVLFSGQIEKMIKENELEGEAFLKKREEILGREFGFSGQVRKNKFFENLELIVSDVKEIDIDKLIEELEKA